MPSAHGLCRKLHHHLPAWDPVCSLASASGVTVHCEGITIAQPSLLSSSQTSGAMRSQLYSYLYQKDLRQDCNRDMPQVNTVNVWTNGPSSQFQNKFIFALSVKLSQKLGLRTVWKYFATNHAKRSNDALGGNAKRTVHRLVMGRQLIVRDAESFATALRTHSSKIEGFHMTQGDINDACGDLDTNVLWDNILAMPGTQNFHQVLHLREWIRWNANYTARMREAELTLCYSEEYQRVTVCSTRWNTGDTGGNSAWCHRRKQCMVTQEGAVVTQDEGHETALAPEERHKTVVTQKKRDNRAATSRTQDKAQRKRRKRGTDQHHQDDRCKRCKFGTMGTAKIRISTSSCWGVSSVMHGSIIPVQKKTACWMTMTFDVDYMHMNI